MSVEIIDAFINESIQDESEYFGLDWLCLTQIRQTPLAPKPDTAYRVLSTVYDNKYYNRTYVWSGTKYLEKRASYRPELSSMDKDTILFIRKNRTALAYNYDYYKNNVSIVTREFLKDPPTKVLYKVEDSYYSWVDLSNLMSDAVNKEDVKAFSIPVLCLKAYRERSFTINDYDGTTHCEIPSTLYIDKDGYVYNIAMNDGHAEYVPKKNYASTYDENTDIVLSQIDTSNTGLGWEYRHLMDDLKVEFTDTKERMGNAIVTFNNIITPMVISSAEPHVGYLNSVLDKASINTNSILTISNGFPTGNTYRPKIKGVHLYSCSTQEKNYFFVTPNMKFYIFERTILDGWRLLRSDNEPIRNNNDNRDVFDVIATSDDQPRNDIFDALNDPAVVCIPFKRSYDVLFAFSRSSGTKYFYSVTDGKRWEERDVTAIDSNITGFQVCEYIGTSLVIKTSTNKYYSTTNGFEWNEVTFVKDTDRNNIIPRPVTDIDDIYKNAKIGMIWMKYYEKSYIDSDGVLYVRDNTNGWYKCNNINDYINEIKTKVQSDASIISNATQEFGGDLDFVYKVMHNDNIDITSIAFYYKLQVNNRNVPDADPNAPLSVEKEVSGVYNVKGYWSDDDDDQLSYSSVTNNTFDYVNTNVVKFDPNNVMCYADKWMILDENNPIEDNGETYYSYKTSDDFVRWTDATVYDGDDAAISGLKHTPGRGVFFAAPEQTDFYVPSYETFLIPNDTEVYKYNIPEQARAHYDLRVKIYKWEGVKVTQPFKASYLVTQIGNMVLSTDTAPIKIGFSVKINPNAFLLLYNGVPMLDGDVYVNPKNNKEIIIDNAVKYHTLQKKYNPLQFNLGGRGYEYSDFTVINCSAEDPTKECYMELDRGTAMYAGKCCYVNFHSDIKGDCILFNGIDHEYYITGKRSIKYIISRYGLNEAVYPDHKYMHVGHLNIKDDIFRNIVKIQFILKDKT